MSGQTEDFETDVMDKSEQDNSSEEIIKVDKKRIKNKRKLRISESDDDDTNEYYQDSCSQNYSSWVQCDNAKCQKWRKIDHIDDEEDAADGKWICAMNKDEAKNTCEASQETIPSDNEESCYTNHKPGNILWGKINGYPWWPCMVENDPDYKTFYWNYPLKAPGEIKTSMHVTFLGEDVSRAWISTLSLRAFTGDEKLKDMGTMTFRKTNFKHAVAKAVEDAKKCLQLTIKERLLKYGFKARYDSNDTNNTADDKYDNDGDLNKSKAKRKKQKIDRCNEKPKEKKRKKITEDTNDKPNIKKKTKGSNKDATKNRNSNSILCPDEVRKALSCIKYDVKEDENEDHVHSNSNSNTKEDESRTVQDELVGESNEDDEDDLPALVQPHIVQIDPMTYCVEYPILGSFPRLDENDEDLNDKPDTTKGTETIGSPLDYVVNAEQRDSGQDQAISKNAGNSLKENSSAKQDIASAGNVDVKVSSDSSKKVAKGLKKSSKTDVSEEKAIKRPKINEKEDQNAVKKDKGSKVARSKDKSLKSQKEKQSTAESAADKKLIKNEMEEKKKGKKMEEKKMNEKEMEKKKEEDGKKEEGNKKMKERKKMEEKKMKEKKAEEKKTKEKKVEERKMEGKKTKEKMVEGKKMEEKKEEKKETIKDSKQQEDDKSNGSGIEAKKKQQSLKTLAVNGCTEKDKKSLDSKDQQPDESSLKNDRPSKGGEASRPSEEEKNGDAAKSKQQTTPVKMKPKKNTFAVPRKKATEQKVQLQVKSTKSDMKKEMSSPKTNMATVEVSAIVDSSSAKDTIAPSTEPKDDTDKSSSECLGQTEKIDSVSDASKTSESSGNQKTVAKISAKSPKKSNTGDSKRKSKKKDGDLSDDDVCLKIEKTIVKPKQTKMSRLSKIAKQYEGTKSIPYVKTSPKPLKSKESSMFMLAMESQMHHSPNKKKALFSPKQKRDSISQLNDDTNVVKISAIVESYCDDEERHSQTKEEKPFIQFGNSPNLNFREIEDKMAFPSISSPPMATYMGNQEVPECENTDPVMPVVKEINALIDDSPEF